MDESPLLRIEDLGVSFATQDGVVQAVNGVHLTLYPRQTLAVVGESGCGKSVSALSTLKLIPQPPGRYDSGRILFDGEDLLPRTDKQMRRVRGNHIAMIFQEPMTSLNPVYTIGNQILEAIRLHRHVPRKEAVEIAVEALSEVGIGDARRRLSDYPHQMSGGMRQRVMIAMALACRPRLLLADEPTTALDVTIQAQILELLRRLQNEHEMAIMLITHDLGVVAENADVVAVMYAGRVVEYAAVEDIFNRPMHPYTRGLMASMPRLGERKHRLATILDQTPDPAVLPDGYAFQPTENAPAEPIERFPILQTLREAGDNPMAYFLRDTAARRPVLHEIAPRHWVACWKTTPARTAPPRPDILYRREPIPAATGEPA